MVLLLELELMYICRAEDTLTLQVYSPASILLLNGMNVREVS